MLIGITTSPRPQRYLIDTIKSIRAADPQRRATVVVSPNFVDPDEDWLAVKDAGADSILAPLVPKTLDEHNAELGLTCDRYAAEYTHRGLQHNSDHLIRSLSDMTPQGGWFVTMQDDAILAPKSVDRFMEVIQYLEPCTQVGMVSFYNPWPHLRNAPALSAYTMGFYGEICLLWRRHCAELFLKFSNVNQAHDLEIARFFKTNRKWKMLAHSPCLAQHVGASSARGDPGKGCVSTPNFKNVDAVPGKKLTWMKPRVRSR